MHKSSVCKWGREFAQRAALYRQWDGALCTSTRFYAAAALINQAFAEALSTPARLLLSQPTLHFFGTLSRALQAVNAGLAAAFVRGSIWSLRDSSLVRLEQAIVQQHLTRLRLAEARSYERLVDEANRWLYFLQMLAPLSAPDTSVSALGNVLRQLHDSRGGRIDFARRRDREAIGNALVVSAHSNAAALSGAVLDEHRIGGALTV
jgi:hypothetical protein